MTGENSQKTRNKGEHTFISLIKSVCKKNLIANIRFNNKTSALLNLMQHNSGSSSQKNKARKKIKDIHIGNEKIKGSQFADNLFIYIEIL